MVTTFQGSSSRVPIICAADAQILRQIAKRSAIMTTPKETDSVIAISASGTADEEQLDEAIAEAWRTALLDQRERAEIAAILGTQESELDPSIPPFQARVRGAGMFGAEILIALAVGFAVGAAKGFGEEEGESVGKAAAKALNRLWLEHIRGRVSPPGTGRLGPEKDEPDES